jgi:hypothetical protein
MSWIGQHKRTWRISLVVLLLLATAGPWVFDKVYVPAEYECRNSIRLEGNFCGIAMSGIRIIPWIPVSMVGSAERVLTGETAFAQGVLEFVGACFLILFFLPILTTLLLSVREEEPRWRQFHIVALCLAVALGALFATSRYSPSNWALWGIWLYSGTLACALVLELFTRGQERTRSPQKRTRQLP